MLRVIQEYVIITIWQTGVHPNRQSNKCTNNMAKPKSVSNVIATGCDFLESGTEDKLAKVVACLSNSLKHRENGAKKVIDASETSFLSAFDYQCDCCRCTDMKHVKRYFI